MITSSNENIFRVTDHWWIPRTKASDAELWGFLWSAPWINGWLNNRKAGDLRRHPTHNVVTVMSKMIEIKQLLTLIQMHFYYCHCFILFFLLDIDKWYTPNVFNIGYNYPVFQRYWRLFIDAWKQSHRVQYGIVRCSTLTNAEIIFSHCDDNSLYRLLIDWTSLKKSIHTYEAY